MRAFSKEVKLWTLAESLGSVRSLFCHPPTMTHASMEPEVRRRVGIGDGLIRLSVGLEDVRDLIEALDVALDQRSAAVSAAGPRASRPRGETPRSQPAWTPALPEEVA